MQQSAEARVTRLVALTLLLAAALVISLLALSRLFQVAITTPRLERDHLLAAANRTTQVLPIVLFPGAEVTMREETTA